MPYHSTIIIKQSISNNANVLIFYFETYVQLTQQNILYQGNNSAQRLETTHGNTSKEISSTPAGKVFLLLL